MQRLEPPTRSHQLGGQPVEQLGMAGCLAHDAKIVRGRDEPFAEVELPDPVDDHPRHQGVFGPGQPAGQPEPATGRPDGGLGQVSGCLGQDGGHSRLDGNARPGGVASLEDMGHGSLWSVLIPDISARQLLGLGRLDGGDPIVQGLERGHHLGGRDRARLGLELARQTASQAPTGRATAFAGSIRNALTASGGKEVRFFPGLPSFGLSAGAKSWSISGLMSASIRSQTRANSALALAMTRVIGGQLGLGPDGTVELVAVDLEDA